MSQSGIVSDNTSSSADIETLTGNAGGAVGPDAAFNIDIVGSGDLTVTGNPGTNTLTISDTGGADIETITGDSGGAVSPDGANNITLIGGSSEDFQIDGIQTEGNPGANTITINLMNSASGTAQTVGAVTADIVTFDMGAVARTCAFDIKVAAFESSTPAGAGYNIFGTARTDGVTATLVGTPDVIVNEEAALAAASVDLVVSGNNAIIRSTGVAGLTIEWVGQTIYTQAL